MNGRFKEVLSGLLLAALLGGVATPAAAETEQILGVFYRGCEELCDGFKATIEASGFDAEVIVRDVEQDPGRLPAIIEEARVLPADLVLTWGTTVTMGVLGTIEDAGDPRFLDDIPVVFTVVADPFGARIAESFEGSGRANVAGTFNRVPEAVNIEVIRQYDPDFDRLGLLFNRNERNSVIKSEELAGLAEAMDFELVALELDPENPGVPDVARIAERMADLADAGVRWLYLGSSSFLRQHGDLATRAAVDNGIAVLSPYEDLVREQRALLSVAARYADVGRLAANLALQILRDDAVPGTLPIAQATDFAYVVNMAVANELGRYPPFAFLQIAEAVND
jgi:putative tryptophan/tyrosine transport system substrate-binding protein